MDTKLQRRGVLSYLRHNEAPADLFVSNYSAILWIVLLPVMNA